MQTHCLGGTPKYTLIMKGTYADSLIRRHLLVCNENKTLIEDDYMRTYY